MRKSVFSFLSLALLACAVVLTGCDSEDDESDAELFVGTWTVSAISDAEGDQTASFGADVQSFSTVFDADGTYDLSVTFVPEDPRTPIALSGPYEVNEGANTITLNGEIPGIGPLTLGFNYDILSDDQIELSAPNALINPIFGTTYTGTVTLTVQRI